MFKNALIYGLSADHVPTVMIADQLADGLASQAYTPPSAQQVMSIGWVQIQSQDDEPTFAHKVGTHVLMRLRIGKKVLPGKAVNSATAQECRRIEQEQGFKPGRKQSKEIKENVIERMLPAAFVVEGDTWVWYDHARERLAIDTASPAMADQVFQMLNKSIENLPLSNIHVDISPSTAMTEWIARDEAPANFTIDQDTEFQSSGEGRASVRYQRGSVEPDQARAHIEGGKQVTRLAMTWADRISFVLSESMAIKRIAVLDVLKEQGANSEGFDGEFLLIAGELGKLIDDLIAALGGIRKD